MADGADTRCALFRRAFRDGGIKRADRRDCLRLWKPFELGIVRLQPGHVTGADRQLAQTVGPDIIGDGDSNLRSNDGTHGDLHVALSHVLMDVVVRKSSKALVLLHRENLGFLGRGCIHYDLGDLPEVHLNTPTFTFLKRAGAAP